MPLAESVQPQRDKNSGNTRPVGLVTCPNCRVVMPRISLKLAEEECHSACNIDPLSRGIGVQN